MGSTSAYHVPSFSCVQQYPAATFEQCIGTMFTHARRGHSTQGLVMLYNANRKVDLAYATQEPPAGKRGFASNLNLGELAQGLRTSLCPWRITLVKIPLRPSLTPWASMALGLDFRLRQGCDEFAYHSWAKTSLYHAMTRRKPVRANLCDFFATRQIQFSSKRQELVESYRSALRDVSCEGSCRQRGLIANDTCLVSLQSRHLRGTHASKPCWEIWMIPRNLKVQYHMDSATSIQAM